MSNIIGNFVLMCLEEPRRPLRLMRIAADMMSSPLEFASIVASDDVFLWCEIRVVSLLVICFASEVVLVFL